MTPGNSENFVNIKFGLIELIFRRPQKLSLLIESSGSCIKKCLNKFAKRSPQSFKFIYQLIQSNICHRVKIYRESYYFPNNWQQQQRKE